MPDGDFRFQASGAHNILTHTRHIHKEEPGERESSPTECTSLKAWGFELAFVNSSKCTLSDGKGRILAEEKFCANRDKMKTDTLCARLAKWIDMALSEISND